MSTHNNANSVSNNIGLIHNIKSRLKRITKNLREHARSEKFTEVLSTVEEEDEQYQKEVIENDRLNKTQISDISHRTRRKINNDFKSWIDSKTSPEPEFIYTPFTNKSGPKKRELCDQPCLKKHCYCSNNLYMIHYNKKKNILRNNFQAAAAAASSSSSAPSAARTTDRPPVSDRNLSRPTRIPVLQTKKTESFSYGQSLSNSQRKTLVSAIDQILNRLDGNL